MTTPRQFREAVERRILDEREASLSLRVDAASLRREPVGRAPFARTHIERDSDARAVTAARAVRIAEMRAQGGTVNEICHALGLTERQFYFAQRSTKAARTQHEEATP